MDSNNYMLYLLYGAVRHCSDFDLEPSRVFALVQDLIAVNGTEEQGGAHLISCALDRGVYVWSIAKGEFVRVRLNFESVFFSCPLPTRAIAANIIASSIASSMATT